MYLKALGKDEPGWSRAGGYVLEVTYLTDQCAGGGDPKASPNSPDETTDDGENFMTKELRDKLSGGGKGAECVSALGETI